MKYFKRFALITVLVSLFTTQASAELIFGVKAAAIKPDVESAESGTNANLQLSYEFLDLALVDIAVEGELSMSQGDAKAFDQDISFDSKGLYLSLRTAGPVYVIGRAGIAQSEISSPNNAILNILGLPSKDDTAPSLGVGIGFSMGIRWELEYTTYEIKDVDFKMVSLGFAF